MNVKRALFVVLAFLPACGQTGPGYVPPHQVQTFRVQVLSVSGQTETATGMGPESPLPFPVGLVDIKAFIQAIDENGEPMADYDRKVSFRVTPGQVRDVRHGGLSSGDLMVKLEGGQATVTVTVDKVFGRTMLWVHDSLPPPSFKFPFEDDEEAPGKPNNSADAGHEEDAGARTYAAGVSQPVWFMDPGIVDVQRLTPEGSTWNNRISPLVGNFLTVERPLPRGDMIVTAIGAEGFYVTDLKAPPFEYSGGTAVGRFNSIFVYSYSYPDGLYLGDRLKSISGTVQEFSGHTQLVFPSWTRVEAAPRPQDIPEPIVFDFSSASGTGFRLCNVRAGKPYGMDPLCGYSNNNVEIETVESSLVKLVNVVPSRQFVSCDLNGDANIPFFRYMVPELPNGGPNWDLAAFGCDEGADFAECQCNVQCVTSTGPHSGGVCSELTNYRNFGQWVVVLDPASGTRINIVTRDALPRFNPADFANEAYEGCTLDVTGMLRQVQAGRPRWSVVARDRSDICGRAPAGKSCPEAIPACPVANQ